MINYYPDKILKRLLPARKVRRLMKGDLTLNKAVLSALSDADFLDKRGIERTALKVVKQYKKTYRQNIKDGDSKAEALRDAVGDKELLLARVKSEVVYQVKEQIKDKYRGERYVWLPSDAEEPDPEHQLNYGKEFSVGDGEMPGDRPGCRCGMRILVAEEKLEI